MIAAEVRVFRQHRLTGPAAELLQHRLLLRSEGRGATVARIKAAVSWGRCITSATSPAVTRDGFVFFSGSKTVMGAAEIGVARIIADDSPMPAVTAVSSCFSAPIFRYCPTDCASRYTISQNAFSELALNINCARQPPLLESECLVDGSRCYRNRKLRACSAPS